MTSLCASVSARGWGVDGSGSIVRVWVSGLHPRQQGELLSAVRGCDEPDAVSAALKRVYRYEIFGNTFPEPFAERASVQQVRRIMQRFLARFERYPMHYVLHVLYAAEIVGHHHPMSARRRAWAQFYERMCGEMRVQPRSRKQLDDYYATPCSRA